MTRILLLVLFALAATQAIPNGFGDRRGVVDVSVISPEKAQLLFDEMRSNKDIPFDFPLDGCFARATAMSRMAEEQKIEMGKVYAEGVLRVKSGDKRFPEIMWGYHVAPVVYVQKDDKPELMVFDPSLFDKPVSVNEWTDIMKATGNPPASVSATYYGSRYQLGPRYSEGQKNSWLRSDLETTDETMKMFSSKKFRQALGYGNTTQSKPGQQSAPAGVR